MSGDVDNNPGGCYPGDVNRNQEDTVVIDIDNERTCYSQSEITREDEETSTEEQEIAVVRNEIGVPQVDIHIKNVSNILGTSNLAYSSDSIDSLPVILDLNENCRYRYSVVIDTLDNDGDGIDYSEALAGPSTSNSSLEFNLRAVPLERTCSCNCHRNDQNAPSYDDVFTDSNKIDSSKVASLDHDDANCNGISCPSLQKHKKLADNLVINLGNARNSPNITPGNTPGRFRRILPSQMVKILNSSGNSPVSDKAPPNYRSLIFSILQDEPPKYEDVTGKKLADELIDVSAGQNPSNNSRVPTFKSRVAGVGIFIGVIIVTVLLLYLSVTGAGTRNPSM